MATTTDLASGRPATTTPRRRAGSVRRTTHVDVGPSRSWDDPSPCLVVTGAARDLRTGDDGTARTMSRASVTAEIADDRRLTRLTTTPSFDTASLRGVHAMEGFRAAALPLADDPASALGQLLRDVPTAVLLAGYPRMRHLVLDGAAPEVLVPPGVLGRMADLCSGWRSGGEMARSIADGRGVPVQPCPPAPRLDDQGDEDAWHDLPALPPGHLRRMRRLDVVPMDGEIVVDAMFRDVYVHAPGDDQILHEYELAGWIDAGSQRLIEIAASEHVVPFGECRLAAGNAASMVGTPVAELRTAARAGLAGIAGCTHLNDLLACLADVPALI